MRIIADLHIHSKYSRSCSKNLTLENICQKCGVKGINLVGTSDFTHPLWFKELKEKLIETKPGLYALKKNNSGVQFIVSTEISCIYSQGGRGRRVHICIIMPSLESAERLNENLKKRGFNLKSDGRPILGISAKNLTQIVLEIDPNAIIMPAHIWTPWFSLFGSKSGFNTLEECFEEMSSSIFAIETGLSSDPSMNWTISALDDLTLLSNSDAHSLESLGREANVFEIEENLFSFNELRRIIKEKDSKKFLYTVEFFPEEGKYFSDGHASCKYCSYPAETKGERCPVCGKIMTFGVLKRVNELSDRHKPSANGKIPFKKIIPLKEIISSVYKIGKNSKKVSEVYSKIVSKENEFAVLLDLPLKELKKIAGNDIGSAIIAMRKGKVKIIPGYDGIYGKIEILVS